MFLSEKAAFLVFNHMPNKKQRKGVTSPEEKYPLKM
jgi:hypothetical protein